jgi:hypothetical protein
MGTTARYAAGALLPLLLFAAAAGVRATLGGPELDDAAMATAVQQPAAGRVVLQSPPAGDRADALPVAPTAVGAAAGHRPFHHAQHESMTCTACHGAGSRHRSILVLTARDCAACHHAPARVTCSGCHATSTLPEPGAVQREVAMSVWPETRIRELPFGHVAHGAVPCRDCHESPVTLAVVRSCGSCHESHHHPDAACAACHTIPQQPVHGAAVHLSCAGAGCHAPAAVPPAPSRMQCLACHPQQQQHEPAEGCAGCHLLQRRGQP